MSGDEKKEFGDYQTPIEFCNQVCQYIKQEGLSNNIKAILEPTCGLGNFLNASSAIFDCDRLFGVEINESYAQSSKKAVPSASIIVGNIFDTNTREVCGTDEVLVIGNPPWATNSNLSYNLPQKINFKGLRGIDALTGSSNFDICEYIILQLLDEYKATNSTICMLCKTSVARNVVLEIDRNEIGYDRLEMLNFNGNKVFGISAAACVLVIRLSSEKLVLPVVCDVKNFEDNTLLDTLTVENGKLKSVNTQLDLEGVCELTWRSGVKHDCSKVMELDLKNGVLINKQKESVNIEENLVFPLVKSSGFKKPILSTFSKYVIVTQTKPKQDTEYIKELFPKTWEYLNSNASFFGNRKSVIYKSSAPFSMFGIGDYSFAPYKVGLSGFYKKPLFCLLCSDKPVMTDDTSYFLPFDDYDMAYTMMLLLNSKKVQEFLLSIAFLDNKRPYTVKLLSRLELKKCVAVVCYDELKDTELELELSSYVSQEMYSKLIDFIKKK